MIRHPPRSPLFPSTPLSRPPHMTSGVSVSTLVRRSRPPLPRPRAAFPFSRPTPGHSSSPTATSTSFCRSEEHTSELQSLAYLVCRLLLEKKKLDNYALLRHA